MVNVISVDDDDDDFGPFPNQLVTIAPNYKGVKSVSTPITWTASAQLPPAPSATTPSSPVKRRGWPLRHCRRQGWYRFHILKMFQALNGPATTNTMNPSEKPWSDHELEVFEEVRQKLATLYNNRYEEYYKMRTEERGLEYHPRNKKPNNFILK